MCRKQRVVEKESFSVWAPVESGTLHRTVLRPILFLSYRNYNITVFVSSKIKLYADDTKIYRELRNPTFDIQNLQTDLDNLANRRKHHGNSALKNTYS